MPVEVSRNVLTGSLVVRVRSFKGVVADSGVWDDLLQVAAHCSVESGPHGRGGPTGVDIRAFTVVPDAAPGERVHLRESEMTRRSEEEGSCYERNRKHG